MATAPVACPDDDRKRLGQRFVHEPLTARAAKREDVDVGANDGRGRRVSRRGGTVADRGCFAGGCVAAGGVHIGISAAGTDQPAVNTSDGVGGSATTGIRGNRGRRVAQRRRGAGGERAARRRIMERGGDGPADHHG